MKLITLNTHSLIEDAYDNKLKEFVHVILREQPEIFALQEVNQSLNMPETDEDLLGFVPCEDLNIVLRKDNHALSVAKLLNKAGLNYYFTWIPIKLGYGIYEEGLAIFSKSQIVDSRQCFISGIRDYNNWKTRKMLGIKVAAYENIWFYTAHFGWWDDEEEPFKNQWNMVTEAIDAVRLPDESYYILGDFNAPDRIEGESYDYVKQSGWYDTYQLADNKDDGITVGHVIDGWHDKVDASLAEAKGMRLDYIWCDKNIKVKTSNVICNGKKYEVVSDHYGVMIETYDD